MLSGKCRPFCLGLNVLMDIPVMDDQNKSCLYSYGSASIRACQILIPDIVMEDNRELRNRLTKKALPEREYHEIDVGNGVSK